MKVSDCESVVLIEYDKDHIPHELLVKARLIISIKENKIKLEKFIPSDILLNGFTLKDLTENAGEI